MAEAGLWLVVAIVAGSLPLGGWVLWRAWRRVDGPPAQLREGRWP